MEENSFAPSSYVTPRMRSSTVSPMELLVRQGHLYRPFVSLTLVKADRRTGVSPKAVGVEVHEITLNNSDTPLDVLPIDARPFISVRAV